MRQIKASVFAFVFLLSSGLAVAQLEGEGTSLGSTRPEAEESSPEPELRENVSISTGTSSSRATSTKPSTVKDPDAAITQEERLAVDAEIAQVKMGDIKSIDVESRLLEAVFKSNRDDCEFTSVLPVSKKGPKTLNMETVGYFRNNTDQLRKRHCTSKGLINQRINLDDFVCRSQEFLFVVDRSGSMSQYFNQVKDVVAKMLASGNASSLKVSVVSANPYRPNMASGSMSETMKGLEKTLGPSSGGSEEEQGFAAALRAVPKLKVSAGACLHVAILSDEEEQSKVALTPKVFLRKLWGGCPSCKNIFVHSVFAPKCSNYHKASELSKGLFAPSSNTSLDELSDYVVIGKPLPLPFLKKPEFILSVHTDQQWEENSDNQMTGLGKIWHYNKDYNSLFLKKDQSQDIPTSGYLNIFYKSNKKIEEKEKCR